jgi:hypothetical protein
MIQNKLNLSPEELQVAIQMVNERAKEHLIDFCIANNPRYQPNWHHEVIADELEKAESNESEWDLLILCMPPRHGKSELATINFPAWYLGRNPLNNIITASYSSELALDFGGKTRDIVCDEPYQQIFGISLKQDDKSKAKWKTEQGGSYTSVGIGGAITGRGANVLIIDDPIKNHEEAESKLIRDKHWDWFTSTAHTRLEPKGKIILILTRWHLDDLAGRILNHPELSKRVKLITFPAIATIDEQFRKRGEPLWKERYDLQALNNIKQTIGIYDWSSLYQQVPILSENQEFKQEWFKKRSLDEVLKLNTRNFLTVDTAYSQKDSANYIGFCENFVDKENKWNLIAYKMRLNPKEFTDYLFTLQEKRNFEAVGIEKTAYLAGLKPFIEEEQRKRNKFFTITELVHNQTQKEIRIRGLIPRYSSGSIYHIDCKDLEDELLTFPKSINDDVMDATAYQLQIAQQPSKDSSLEIFKQIREYQNQINSDYEGKKIQWQ